MQILTLLLLVSTTTAHFILNYPTTLGFNQNAEDDSPCGGATISFTNTTAFHLSGDAIAVTTLHPQSNFLYRATTDQIGTSNWTVLSLVAEYGLGAFCEPALSVPDSDWEGKMGLLQVVQNAEDGVHYQCAAVNFVAGTQSNMPAACQNASGNSAAFTQDTTLLPVSGTSSPTASGSVSSTASAAPSASSTKFSGAGEKMRGSGWWAGGVGLLVFGVLLV